jgi:GNAT superfamily N-acetyltransferase
MTVHIRPRTADDLDELEQIARHVQTHDGYPGVAPRDMRRFLASSDALDAWVAECDGEVAGHVALHRSSLDVVMDRAATFLRTDRANLAVVARLIADPKCRRRGVGRALLTAAAGDARRRELHPILDVVTEYAPAIALYEACGWQNAGDVTMVFRDGLTLHSYVYVAPPHR